MRFRRADIDDLDDVVALHGEFYRHGSYPFDEAENREAARVLLETPAYGQVWVAEEEGSVVAYFALAFGYSLEFRGRDAFLDELYVTDAWRGKGLGGEALTIAEEACRAEGIRALHLEVERDNLGAIELYRRRGFVEHTRYLMTRKLQ
jgi:ribosomal protein S18 acetylase RimI-like enzyme